MKKIDFSLGQGREMLTREQMKAVTGGLKDGTIHCNIVAVVGGASIPQSGYCGLGSVDDCNAAASGWCASLGASGCYGGCN
jgi:hypothetical protein